MRLWIKFFPDIDTASVELTPQNTLNDLKNKIFELSNLTDADSIKVVYRSLPLVQKSMPLADLNLTGEETFSVIVNSCKAGKFKLNKPKAVGPIVYVELFFVNTKYMQVTLMFCYACLAFWITLVLLT